MTSRLLEWVEALRSSFWVVPGAMALAAVGLSWGAITLDSGPVGQSMANSLGWLWSGGAEGARSLLSTVASSMITVAGTVFSITIAALTLASSQFGPKLLRNFTSDTGNRVVLGTFIATYVYCLLVLRTVRGQSAGDFVPYLSVTGGLLLALASLVVLIYFIHHVATAIQAEKLIASVGEAFKADILRLCPGQRPDPAGAPPAPPMAAGVPVRAGGKGGYVLAIDRDGLLELAERHDLVVEVLRHPGDFAFGGEALLRVLVPGGRLAEEWAAALRDTVSLGRVRSASEDLRYGANQIVEIAARALSPGINDPFTAMSCIDWLMEALAAMSDRHAPLRLRCGRDGQPRLLEESTGFETLLEVTFGRLCSYAAEDAAVLAHMLRALARLARHTRCTASRRALATQAGHVAAAAQAGLETAQDRALVAKALADVLTALERG